MKDVITLQSCNKGLVGDYVNYGSWTAFNVFVMFVLYHLSYMVIESTKRFTTVHELLNSEMYGLTDTRFLWGLCIAGIILFGIIALFQLCFLVGNLYKAKRVVILDKNKHTISNTEYSFPYKVETNELKFDRLIKSTIVQGTFSRIFNTGTLILNVLVYANGDSIEKTVNFPYIKNPFEAKEKIIEGALEYSGLEVRIK